ncbi:SGNH/GDSL hydrolase family protein [Paenibacillus qinlingensis]|uniref:GDSL family lipase n=1 Tax=Paenibacillus qinlingensis TaxID=1837343 RepID=A0ABU1P112_9BACL|nr:SGNH/GDSL hydrolase family protein [Paenibacillus qinlingensis]MDR6553435.1 hypothetical protein [Paenibacillus qinlingensis]
MKTIAISERYFLGAISLEENLEGIKPWRLPFDRYELFPPNGIGGKAENPAGVRLAFETDTENLTVSVVTSEDDNRKFDCVLNGELWKSVTLGAGESEVVIEGMPTGNKELEIYLTQSHPVTVKSVLIDNEASIGVLSRRRFKWITYGSSITQCSAAESPALTWPAIVARTRGWDLTCLGFGGQCHLEPMVARMIRDREADFISLCLGINVYGQSSLGLRTFQSAVIGFISIVREKHPGIPIAVISPIFSPSRETTDNIVGLSLTKMREEIRLAIEQLRAYGDSKLTYVDGLDLFDQSLVEYLPDQLHPDAEGYKLMAANVLKKFSSIESN